MIMSSCRAIIVLALLWGLAPLGLAQENADDLLKLFVQAIGHRQAGEYDKALALMERVAAAAPSVLGDNSPNYAAVLGEFGRLYVALGQDTKAQPFFERTLKIQEGQLGPDHLDVAVTLNEIGLIHLDLAQYAKAEALFDRGLKIREAKVGPEHPDVARSLVNLASLYHRMGQHAKAEPLFLRSLKILEPKLGPDHLNVATPLNNLASLYLDMAQYAKAEPLLQRSLKIRETKLGPEHSDVANSLNNLASLYQDMGQYAKAEPLFLRSLKIAEVKLGPDHLVVARGLNNLASLYWRMTQYGKAEPLYKRSLQIRQAKLGPDHLDVANTLHNLASLYVRVGEHSEADRLFARSRKIVEDKLGSHHPLLAQCLNEAAFLYHAVAQHAKAESLYERTLAIREAALGKDHPDVAQSLENLAATYAAQARWDDASRSTDRSRRIVRRYVGQILSVLPEQEQLSFLENTDQGSFQVAQSLGLTRKDDTTLVALSAAWVINGKGMVQHALAQRAVLARDKGDPAMAKLAQELARLRSQLAALVLAHSPQAVARQAQIATLTQKEQELSRKLGQAAGRPTRDDPWIELDEVRRAMPADAVLVEISRFQLVNFRAGFNDKDYLRGDHYAAWIVPSTGKGDVRLIDLGPAGPIEKAIETVRKSLREAPQRIRQEGEAESEKTLHRTLEGLSKLVLEPLLLHVADTKHWILSPDAELWLVPWAALPLKDGKYAIEQYQIGYVTSGRDIVSGATKAAVTRPLLLADPDYDLSASEVVTQTRDVLRGLGVAPAVSLAGQRLRGTIGAWNVSFAFGDDGRVTIRDGTKADKSLVKDAGRWKVRASLCRPPTRATRASSMATSLQASALRTRRPTAGSSGCPPTSRQPELKWPSCAPPARLANCCLRWRGCPAQRPKRRPSRQA
jgi:tetratricopeptide (TPR) repeat protein